MSRFKNLFRMENDDDEEYEDEVAETEEKDAPAKSSRQPRTVSTRVKPNFILCKPDSRDAMFGVADDVLDGKAVILNLEKVQKDQKRIIDFLGGVVYALDGSVKKVSDYTYLIAPGGIDITGDIDEATGDYTV